MVDEPVEVPHPGEQEAEDMQAAREAVAKGTVEFQPVEPEAPLYAETFEVPSQGVWRWNVWERKEVTDLKLDEGWADDEEDANAQAVFSLEAKKAAREIHLGDQEAYEARKTFT